MSHIHRLLLGILLAAGTASASEIYVDNLNGRDRDDGLLPVGRQGSSGPVQSLARASQIARFADVIVLKNTGTPYYGSLSLTGRRHSGNQSHPFVVFGNGATISGLRSVPPEGWRKEGLRKDGPQLWKLTLTRKGYYQLLRDGRPLPETIPEEGACPLETLPPGQWVSWRGSLYFRQDGSDSPDLQNFAVTADQTGISLHKVSYVLIVDVKVEHFRFDGIHAQGLCEHVELDHVTSIENGRAGVVASGASRIDIFGGDIARNGRHQILALDRSTAEQHPAETEPPSPN